MGGAALLLVGTLALWLCGREIRFATTSLRWRQVTGRVSEVEITRDADSDRYHAEVHYVYRIDGDDIAGSRLRWGPVPSFAKKRDAEQFLSRFRTGHPATVYVDPGQPTRSVLLPGLNGWTFLAPVFACIPIWMGASMLLRSIAAL